MMPTQALALPSGGEALLYIVVRYSAVGLPLLVLFGFQLGGWATYAGFLLVFVFYFLVELVLLGAGYGTTTTQSDEFRYTSATRARHEQACLLFFSLAQLVVIPAILLQLPGRALENYEILGTILSMGVMAGSVGGLASHEFIHRSTRWERALGTLLLASFNYAHFKVSHLGGHHRNVGLHHDWSTARLGETSFAFLLRAVGMGLIGAFQLEARRLSRLGHWKLSLNNFVVRYALFQLALWTLVAHLGTTALIIMAGYSALAICFAEMVNYLSHYGLTRDRRPDGSPEPFQDRHTWESNNKVTNWFIFNAGKHVHHHRNPGATHDELKLAHDKPYLPHGLPLMTLIAFVPPLYFRVMDRLLEANGSQTLAR
jgi:alkane 1-monooxygenase